MGRYYEEPEKRATKKPDRGVVGLRLEIRNQDNEAVQFGNAKVLVRLKNPQVIA
jgi:hypothetical protein